MHTEDGKPYCKTHAPSIIAAKRDARNCASDKFWKEKYAKRKREEDCVNACAGIPDPAAALALAREALSEALAYITAVPSGQWIDHKLCLLPRIDKALAALAQDKPATEVQP